MGSEYIISFRGQIGGIFISLTLEGGVDVICKLLNNMNDDRKITFLALCSSYALIHTLSGGRGGGGNLKKV